MVGTPYIQNYTSEDYHTPEDQIWSIIQDTQGLMYFANNNGILEFDGNSWRLIEIPNKSTIRSFAFDPKIGRIYVGAVGDFGYLETDSTGEKYFVSLLQKIPERFKSFEDVWHISVIHNTIVFRTTSAIYLYQNDTIKTLLPTDRFHTSFKINNEYYVREWNKGLLRLSGDSLAFVGQSHIFANKRIYAMLPFKENKILIVTRGHGVYIFSPTSETRRFLKPDYFSQVNTLLIEKQPYYGVKRNDNEYIIGTLQNGILIFNDQGEIIQHLDERSGLNNSLVLSLFVDKQKNLWAGLNNGISYIIKNSPYSIFNEKNGLEGTAYMAEKFNNKLYVGTSLGLFYEEEPNYFSLIKNTKGQSWYITKINHKLFLGHSDGVFIIEKNQGIKITPNIGTVWSLHKINQKPYILAATNNGFYILECKNNEWRLKNKVKGFNESSRYIQIAKDNTIWVSHANKGIYKLKLSKQLDRVVHWEFYDTNSGLPSNTHNYVLKIKDQTHESEIIFGTERGIYQYNKQTNRFKPHPVFSFLPDHGFIDEFVQDKDRNIYFQQGDEKGVLKKQENGTYRLERTAFLKLKGLFIEHISIVDTNRILYSCKEGVIQYNPNQKINFNQPYKAVIRKITANDSLIYEGNDSISPLQLPYQLNNLNFIFSALYFEDPEETEFSFYLEGFNDSKEGWSKWSTKKEKEYTNLNHGKYIFKVKARNIYEIESEVAEFHFQILAPWYNTIIAYIIYGIIAIFLLWIILSYYTQRLQKEKENLEKIVKERTKEIIRQKEAIEKINNQLKKLSIVASKTSNAVIIFSYDGRIEWFNDSFSKIYGYSYEEFIREKGNNIFNASSNKKIKSYVEQCIRCRSSVIYETQLETRDNDPVWIQTTLTPIVDDHGNIEKLVAIDTDITALKKAESEIMQKNEEILSQNEEMLAQNEELEQHRHHLQELVSERTADLKKAKEHAEESDRLKSAFLANMSHEIRTPMNAIVGFTDLLNDPDLSDQERKELITHINTNSETLLHLIDDIIDLAKIEANQVDINKKNCHLFDIIQEVFNTFSERKREKDPNNKIDFKLSVDEKLQEITLFTDPLRIQQILSNLIQNAFKFTEKGSIEIGYEFLTIKESPFIRFFVKDTGIGLSEDQQKIIFDRFNKAEDNKQKLYRGAGLGLAISKSLIELLGGKISVKSEKENPAENKQGFSEFYFTIPFINQQEKTNDMTPNQSEKGSPTYNWSSKKILIAEDEDSNYRFLEMVLNKTRSEVIWAKDGFEAIEKCKKHEPDLILMDIKMPNMDGLEATREIKKLYPQIPIVAQTAFAMENDEKLSLEAGCNAYLSKPIRAKKLLNTLATFLN
jgi:PAS domain S-box-containing protein